MQTNLLGARVAHTNVQGTVFNGWIAGVTYTTYLIIIMLYEDGTIHDHPAATVKLR